MTGQVSGGAGAVVERRRRPRNPFATRHTLPGRLPALDSCGEPIEPDAMLDRLRALGGTAAIQGPHGSGKTTLLTHLAAALERRGWLAVSMRLRRRCDALAALSAVACARPGATVCIDSWERMGAVPGLAARLIAGMVGCRLLVTSHRETGFPLLARCEATRAVLDAIVQRLPGHAEWMGSLITAADVRRAFDDAGGNLREAVFALYDRFEEVG